MTHCCWRHQEEHTGFRSVIIIVSRWLWLDKTCLKHPKVKIAVEHHGWPGLDKGITLGNCLLEGLSGLKEKRTKKQKSESERLAHASSYPEGQSSSPTWLDLCRAEGRVASDSDQTPRKRWAESWCTPRRTLWPPLWSNMEKCELCKIEELNTAVRVSSLAIHLNNSVALQFADYILNVVKS